LNATFVIDSSSLIRLSRENPRVKYSSLWDRVEELIDRGFLRAPREVHRELERRDDELLEWSKARGELFVDPDEAQTRELVELLKKFPTLVDSDRIGPFADPWVVALAVHLSSPPADPWIVVTEEQPKGAGSTKIPDLCTAFGIECINLIGLVSLILEPR
jgi:hypothetical protein